MSVQHGNALRAIAEPLTSVVMGRSRRDWAARARADAHQSERYTRFVVIAKRVLLAFAGVLLTVVLIYSLQPRQPNGQHIAMMFERLGIVNNDLAMIKPRLTGTDDEGDPYVVTADMAIQDHLNAKRARLTNIEGDVTLKDGAWISATSPSGYMDASHPAERMLDLAGPIAAFSDNGYEIHTITAKVDMGSGIITGNRVVTGQGPLGTFRADRFKIDRGNRIVYLYGNVRMTIYGRGMRGS